MPDSSQNPNPFEIVTPSKSKKVGSKGVIIAVLVTVFLGLGTFLGVLLVRQNQNVEEQAACLEQCPGKDGILRNCHPPESDGSSEDSVCNVKGRIAPCGGKNYCCPASGGTWTTNMTACASPSASATASASPSPSPSHTATSTATSTSTSTATALATSTATVRATTTAAATQPPVPETGTGWPTYVGIGLGIVTIVGSLLLAL